MVCNVGIRGSLLFVVGIGVVPTDRSVSQRDALNR